MMIEDWIEVEYGDILDYEQPTKYIVNTTDYKDEYNIPVLTAGKTFIKGFTNETENIFDKVPVIIFDDFTTASQFVDFKFKVKSSAMKILSPKINGIDIKYIFYGMQLNHIKAETHKRYWISVYSKMTICIPPRPIQQAIVNKIEELFLLLEEGITDLKKAQDQLRIYRESVLKNAFEGTLVDKNWKTSNLNDIADIRLGKMLDKEKNKGDLFPYLRNINVRWGYFDLTDLSHMRFMENELEKYSIKKGDLIMCEGGEPGRCAIWNHQETIQIQKALHRIRPIDSFEPFFLYYYFLYYTQRKEFVDFLTGTTIKHLTGKELKKIPINYPINILDQQLIVKGIESRFSVCDELEHTISEALEKAAALRQSILKKAFSGELLTENEINACKKEADYESSKELLNQLNEKNRK